MSDDRKKPLWPWIAALLIGLPVLYVLSFGPACWTKARSSGPSSVPRLAIVYVPVGWVGTHSPDWLRRTICWYAHVGMPRRSAVVLPVDLSGNATWLTPKW